MDIKPIGTKADYRAALKAVESLMTANGGTPDGDRLDVLVTLIEAYEQNHFPMDVGAVCAEEPARSDNSIDLTFLVF